jgi:hypothetical protein
MAETEDAGVGPQVGLGEIRIQTRMNIVPLQVDFITADSNHGHLKGRPAEINNPPANGG